MPRWMIRPPVSSDREKVFGSPFDRIDALVLNGIRNLYRPAQRSVADHHMAQRTPAQRGL